MTGGALVWAPMTLNDDHRVGPSTSFHGCLLAKYTRTAHHRKCSEMQFLPMENPQKLIFSNAHMAHMLYLQHKILRATKVEHLFWESDPCFPSPFYDLLKIVRYAFKRNKVYFCFAILFLYNKGFGNYEDPPMLGKFSNTQKLN